jgi:hypothetical protein
MPKFIGRTISGAKHIEPNSRRVDYVRLSYSQAKLLSPEHIFCSLDTSDKGSRGSYAKRWYRWYAAPEIIIESSNSTVKMIERAVNCLIDWMT